jgi:NodT family efflux transporter outer membrane factor (OMF) lipoprotein
MKFRSTILPLLMLAGCMVGPNYHKPVLVLPTGYKAAPGWVPAAPADAAPKGAWWTSYGDTDLNRLEPMVAVSNQTLAADYFAYQQAIQIVQETRGTLFPTLGLTGGATREGNGGGGNSGAATGTTTGATVISSAGSRPRTRGTADWTPDIWGKIRRQVQSNVAAAQVSAADLANATLSAQAMLATDYVDLRASDAAIDLFRQTVAADQKSLTITQNQANAGVASPLDAITARTQLEGAQANLINAGVARAQYEHAIAVLAGHAPVDFTIPPGPQIATVPAVPLILPSTLLQRRPDIAAAERAMDEANAQIGIAIGAYYPDLSLSALGGYSADPIGGLFSVSNALWSLGANVSATLFAGGTRSATVAAAQFGYDESLATYRETVLTALQQVEDQLAALDILARQAVVEQAAVKDAARAVTISLNEYLAGTQAYTTVVTAQLTLLGDQETALTIQQNRLLASVALFQALGGGFDATQLPTAAALQQTLPFAP